MGLEFEIYAIILYTFNVIKALFWGYCEVRASIK